MIRRFESHDVASAAARERAETHRLDVAIRRCREYGKDGFNVSFAAGGDSDYALAEIVRPSNPRVPWCGGAQCNPARGRTGHVSAESCAYLLELAAQARYEAAQAAERAARRAP